MINSNPMASNAPPFPGDFDYSSSQPQQLAHHAHHHHASAPIANAAIGGGGSMRPTLDVYYQHQHQPQLAAHHHHSAYHTPVPTPSPHHNHHPTAAMPQHAYYAATQQQHYLQHYASTPAALASSSSLKRKMSSSTTATTPASTTTSTSTPNSLSQDKLCDLCHHPDPILFSNKCGHLFHSRCANVWPLNHCPVCHVELAHISLLRIDMNEQIETRSGKWTRAEEKFIEIILQEFDRSCFPLANGTPVRLILAKLLNCSTMRLSKKFQKNALGKRTFRIPKPTKGAVAMEFNREDHIMREKEFSRLETIFRHELVEQFRRENNTDEGAYAETENLRKAVKQFWVTNFLKFAVVIGQPVEGLDISDAKKKKLALQMLRDGQYDDLLSWHRSASPTSTSTSRVSTVTSATRGMHLSEGSAGTHHPQSHWPAATSALGYTPITSNQDESDLNHQPAKKQRTPETVARLQINCDVPPSHFELHSQASTHPVASYDYNRVQQQQQQQQQQQPQHQHQHAGYAPQYSSHGYPREVYAQYPVMKQEKAPLQYDPLAHSPQNQPHTQVQPHPYPEQPNAHGMTAYLDRSGGGPVDHPDYRNSGSAAAPEDAYQHMPQTATTVPNDNSGSGSQAPCPWDGLLEEISEPTPHVVDPSLQAWSNIHIM